MGGNFFLIRVVRLQQDRSVDDASSSSRIDGRTDRRIDKSGRTDGRTVRPTGPSPSWSRFCALHTFDNSMWQGRRDIGICTVFRSSVDPSECLQRVTKCYNANKFLFRRSHKEYGVTRNEIARFGDAVLDSLKMQLGSSLSQSVNHLI